MANSSSEIRATQTTHRISSNSLEARTDQELIDVFLQRNASEAEEAFKALVVRHGPMVLGVCRQTLGTEHDAEDAFQAVFLVLARKAETIRNRGLLASWLYEVAYRISVKARVARVRRRTRERQVVAMAGDSFDPRDEYDRNDAWNELRAVLQTEVERLPEKYRNPVILCYLEGKSNTEAARILDWPVGSVKGRLARARDILHSRLMRRNLVLSATFLLYALHRETVFAEVVPSSLLDSTVQSSLSIVGKQGAGPSRVSTEAVMLMEDYIRPRFRRNLLAAIAAMMILAGVVGLSRASFSQSRLASLHSGFVQMVDTLSRSLPALGPARAGSACGSSSTHQ